MSASILIQDEVEVPGDITSLADFRRWTCSEKFPESGRVDYISGRLEIDLSPDNLYFHTAPRSEIGAVIGNRLKGTGLGRVFVGRTRISVPDADLSAEPDVIFVSHTAIREGRVRQVPTSDLKRGSYIEIEGPPDLVVEVVSNSSKAKDTERLFTAYYAAGVFEYWLVDARGRDLSFQIFRRGEEQFVPAPIDTNGFQPSLLGVQYRFEHSLDPSGNWDYELIEAECLFQQAAN